MSRFTLTYQQKEKIKYTDLINALAIDNPDVVTAQVKERFLTHIKQMSDDTTTIDLVLVQLDLLVILHKTPGLCTSKNINFILKLRVENSLHISNAISSCSGANALDQDILDACFYNGNFICLLYYLPLKVTNISNLKACIEKMKICDSIQNSAPSYLYPANLFLKAIHYFPMYYARNLLNQENLDKLLAMSEMQLQEFTTSQHKSRKEISKALSSFPVVTMATVISEERRLLSYNAHLVLTRLMSDLEEFLDARKGKSERSLARIDGSRNAAR